MRYIYMRYIYGVRGEGEARWAPRSGRTVWVSAGGPSASTAGCPAPSNSKRVAAKAKSCGDVGRWAAVRTCWTLEMRLEVKQVTQSWELEVSGVSRAVGVAEEAAIDRVERSDHLAPRIVGHEVDEARD